MPSNPLTLEHVVIDVATSMGLSGAASNPGCITDAMRELLAHRLNAALQIIYSSPEGQHYYQEDETITLVTGQSAYILPDSVASVLGPVRYSDGTPLHPLAHRSEFDLYSQVYEGKKTPGANVGTPCAYFVDSYRDTDDLAGDSKEIVLRLRPVPDVTDAGAIIEIEVRKEPPRYSAEEIESAPTTPIPMPDGYAESVLLPLVRLGLLTASGWTTEREIALTPRFEAEAQNALAMIGVTDSAAITKAAVNLRGEEYPRRK